MKLLRASTGFTLVELTITIAVMGISSVVIFSMFMSIQNIQQSAAYNDIATRAAQREIETLRSSNYESLTPGQVITFTNSISSVLPQHTGTATISEPSTDIRRIDAVVTYKFNGATKTVTLSADIGAIGLTH